MNRRKFIRSLSLATTVAVIPNIAIWGNKKNNKVELSRVRKTILNHCNSLLDKSGPYGSYRGGTGMRPSLYASCDVAIMRTIMGENLMVTLSDLQRQQWIDFINSFAINRGSNYGSYCDTYGHSFHHANGMVIGALGVLGGKQKYPVKLYDEFDQIEEVIPWLESLDWAKQWDASHLFWGGMHCYSMSSRCSDAWKDEVFAWLDENIDEKSGWWKKGVTHADRHQPLGGSVHILPIYQHLRRRFPYPEKVIDSVLDLQLPNGRWYERESIHVMAYLELDALYALMYMSGLAPDYRTDDIRQAVNRYADLVTYYWNNHSREMLSLHPHHILAGVGTFGLLNQLNPDRFTDDVQWTDIFSDVRFYQTSEVEVTV
ncbi:MAG: hypothetical protein AMS23_01750 [Bacteroides sp. SM1_62]|nr:MAG: hypothetical protein AMS23_01750 [Bacteroides sp. SM1_62]